MAEFDQRVQRKCGRKKCFVKFQVGHLLCFENANSSADVGHCGFVNMFPIESPVLFFSDPGPGRRSENLEARLHAQQQQPLLTQASC